MEQLRDFLAVACEPYGVEAVDPDSFAVDRPKSSSGCSGDVAPQPAGRLTLSGYSAMDPSCSRLTTILPSVR